MEPINIRETDTEPFLFTYPTKRSSGALIGLWAILLFICTCFVLMVQHLLATQGGQSSTDWIWTLGSCATLAILYLGPLLFCGKLISLHRDIRRRGAEQISVSPTGIRYTDGAQVLTASWQEVTNFYTERKASQITYVVCLASKVDYQIRFNDWITDSLLLREIIAHRAPLPTGEIVEDAWRTVEEETVSPDGSNYGTGNHSYTYRTRPNRNFLLFLTGILALIPLIVMLRQSVGLEVPSPDPEITLPRVALVCLVLYGWWRYYAARIVIDDTGITQHTSFGPRHLRWSEVQRWRTKKNDGSSPILLEGENGVRICALSWISNRQQIIEEIKRRTDLSPLLPSEKCK